MAGLGLDAEELLAAGVELEGHADNLAAALAGGVCLTWDSRIARLADDTPAVPIALVPEATVSTAAARAALPETVRHADAAFTAGRAALLGAALATGSAELFAEALADRMHEPYRAVPRAAAGGRSRAASRRRARLHPLGLRPDRRRLGASGVRRRMRGRARVAASPTSPSDSCPSLREERTPVSTDPYSRPSDPAKRHSAALTDGPDRAGARSMLKGTGFTDDDLAKPIIGVATTWIETMPCNLNQRDLAVDVKRGIREAGATPMEFNTIAVSDGVSMGTSGMRASLVSREVIADSIELVARGHLFDGLVCLVACDKTTPGAIMALGRLDIPAVVFYTGSIAPGLYRGREVSIGDVYEAIGAYAAGKMSAEELHELESVACPAAGACGGQFTANTMSTMVDFLGLTPLGRERHSGDERREGGGGLRDRQARRRRRAARSPSVAGGDEAGGRERRGCDRRHGRLDERRPPPRRDRTRVRHRLHDRRLRPHLGRDADRRRHEAVGPVPRDRRLPRRRRRPRRA